MRIIKFLIIAALFIPFAGCEKTETFNNTEDQVGSSRVTRFPVFQVKGDQYVVIRQGSTFTEPGVKAFEGTTELQVTTSGTVNTAASGIYVLNYSAVNKDGFSASASRTVIVIPGAETPGSDLSGKYNYIGSSTFQATVTKLGEATYRTDNAWSGLTVIPIIFISLDGKAVTVPLQTTGFGRASGTGTYNPTTKRLVFSLNLLDQGISNSARTWEKQ
jgi:hypothetical protein